MQTSFAVKLTKYKGAWPSKTSFPKFNGRLLVSVLPCSPTKPCHMPFHNILPCTLAFTNRLLLAVANNRNVIITTDSSRPLFRQIEIFSDILTVYFNCKYFPLHTRELLGLPPRNFSFWERHLTIYHNIKNYGECTRTNDIIRMKLIKKNSKILYIRTWCSLRWCNYFFAVLQIILSLACVNMETHKLSPGPVNVGASGPLTKKIRKNLRCFKFGQQILPNYVASSSPW